jgi:hypothetical protein
MKEARMKTAKMRLKIYAKKGGRRKKKKSSQWIILRSNKP